MAQGASLLQSFHVTLKFKILTDLITCRPHNLGWLRRPELDHDKEAVWELPNGELFSFPASSGEPVIRIIKTPKDISGA